LAAFGGRYARLRTDSRLTGRGASAELVAVYYGDGEQVHDFRTFQHHDARDTRSDLLFKGSQDGSSGSVYSGLIHIHPDGAGSNAFQTNRNIKLSPDAWAWSVPNLEIENNDVHCSHASTVSPVDVDQQFYLQSRGVPPVAADRLIVAGFFDEAIDRLPVAAARSEVRRLVAEKLDQRFDQREAS
jgi:Fe-S cluster assembly protein SufD